MSYEYIVEPPESRHRHNLPHSYNTPNTVVKCSCGTMFVWQYSGLDDNGYSDGWGWQTLSRWRPKHREARRLVKEHHGTED